MIDIKEGNRLIALFMGMTEHNHGSYITFRNQKGEHVFESVLQYNSSWEWLMPVVDKIESFGYVLHNDQYQKVHRAFFKDSEFNDVANGSTNVMRIECWWEAIIDFIKWYNEQKQSDQ